VIADYRNWTRTGYWKSAYPSTSTFATQTASAIATNLRIVFSNASTGNMGKLFLDQYDHFGVALVKLQSYFQLSWLFTVFRIYGQFPWGFAASGMATIYARGGVGIRTIISI
jgi:hypothetical protein